MSFKSPLRALPSYRMGREAAMGKVDAEINVVAPAITPTPGAEMLIDPGMEINPAVNWLQRGTPTTFAQSAVQVHSGNWSLAVANDAANEGPYQVVNLTQYAWYQCNWWVYHSNAEFVQKLVRTGNNPNVGTAIFNANTDGDVGGAWKQTIGTFRCTVAGQHTFQCVNATNLITIYDDDFSLKALSGMTTLLGTRSAVPGNYQCTPTVANYTSTGILLRYADANNFLYLLVNRHAGQAQLIKRIAGVETSVIAGAIVYGAASPLKVSIAANETDYTMSYAGVQVGATTVIADAGLGTNIYGFNTFTGNSVGTVTTSKN